MGIRGVFDRLDQTYLSGIVKRAKRGGSNDFAELFASVSGRQLYYLTRLFGSREKALEMMPAVFSSAKMGLPTLTRDDLFMPWLCRISALVYLEEERIEKFEGSEYDLSQILNLPLAESQIMLMRMQGLSEAETGDILNVGRRTVRRFEKAARRHLARGARGIARAQTGAKPGTQQSRARDAAAESSAFGLQDGRGTARPHTKNSATGAPAALTTLETSEILDAVFSACGGESNTVPMETLSSYAVYRKERFTLQRAILAMALLVFMMLPLLFVLPGYSVSVEENGERGLPVYSIEVDSLLPVGRVLARIKDHSLPVYEAGAKEFTVEPTRNGDLNISVELVNRQMVSGDFEVTSVDAEGPQLVSSEKLEDGFMLNVSDAGIGVDYREVYAVSASGDIYYPISADETGIVFEYPDEAWDVYVPDHIGNTLHLSVKLNK